MAIIQCESGHYYDNNKFMSCPHCRNAEKDEGSLTVRLNNSTVESQAAVYLKERGISYKEEYDEEKTVGVFSKSKGNDFVTGWLVCISGAEKGRDYKLRYGVNKIGRSKEMDVYLEEDRQVARDHHCSVIYEYNKNEFFVIPQKGNIVYLNNEFLEDASKILAGDVLTIGESQLEFIAFCRGTRRWKKNI